MKNHAIIKCLFASLLCAFFASCNQEELDAHNETYFIDLIKNQIEANDEMVEYVLKEVNKQGNRPYHIEVYQSMIELQTAREKLLDYALANNFEYFNDTLIVDYQVFIQKVCEEEDSFAVMEVVKQELIPIQELNQLQKTPSKFQKIIWAYHCLYLENALLERYSMQIGSYCGFRTTVDTDSFSSTKNISLGKVCEVIFVPVKSTYKTHYDIEVVYDGFTFFIDSLEAEIDYKFEQIGFAGFVSFVPSKKGFYQIRGESHFKLPKSAGFRKNRCCESSLYYEFEIE